MKVKRYLGLDVGGTNLAAGVVDEQYKIIAKAVIPSGAGRSIEEITGDMVKVLELAAQKVGMQLSDFAHIGIGMPSCVNPQNGLLVHANCFEWRNVPIFDYLERFYHGDIYIENDANCAVLGEMLAGTARGYENIIMLTLGTGLGSGIILNGKIYAGADQMGAELGHIKLVYKGKKCTCGQLGCADAYCSARGLADMAQEALVQSKDSILMEMCGANPTLLNAKMVVEAVSRQDKTAIRVFDQYLDYLVAALSTFTVIFRPEIFILGGGLANAGKVLTDPLKERMPMNTFAGTEIGVPKIETAACGNDAGIIGAAFVEKYGIDRRKNRGDRHEI